MSLHVGFSVVDITPPLDTSLAGYYQDRRADGMLDPLYARALVISQGDLMVSIVSCDLVGAVKEILDPARERASALTNIPVEQIMVSSTHTHTGPVVRFSSREKGEFAVVKPDEEYIRFLISKIGDSVSLAVQAQVPCDMSVGNGRIEGIAFNRRYRMCNGSVMTNPRSTSLTGEPIRHPDLLEHAGPKDETVRAIVFKAINDGGLKVIVNYALHGDIVKGTKFSADFPGFIIATIQRQYPNSEVLFLNGPCGDINHINCMDPGSTSSGHDYSRKVGTLIGAEVIKCIERAAPMDNLKVRGICSQVSLPLRDISADDIEKAKENLSTGSRSHRVVFHRTMDIAELGKNVDTYVQAIAIGDVAILGLPGEIFSQTGLEIRDDSIFKHLVLTELANDNIGYVPTAQSFDEGGYEVESARVKPEAASILRDTAISLLSKLYKN